MDSCKLSIRINTSFMSEWTLVPLPVCLVLCMAKFFMQASNIQNAKDGSRKKHWGESDGSAKDDRRR